MEQNAPKILLTLEETAKALGIGKTKMNEISHMEGFPKTNIGRSVRVYANQIEGWLKANEGRL